MQNINLPSEEIKTKFNTITPFSKYLAIIIFIILPFLGGWVGYQYGYKVSLVENTLITETTEVGVVQKDVSNQIINHDNFDDLYVDEYLCDHIENSFDTCFRIYRDDSEGMVVLVNDISELYHQQIDKFKELQKLFFDKERKILYFESFTPKSDACCGIVKYNLNEGKFEDIKHNIISISGDVKSPTGRYFATVNFVDNKEKLQIFDLKTESFVLEISPDTGETFMESLGGFAGPAPKLKWLDYTELQYGVYKKRTKEQIENNEIDNELIEYRILDLKGI